MGTLRIGERRFLGQLAFRVAMAGILVMISLFASSGSSRALVVTTWTATNNSGFTATDFEGTWTGTGGSLDNLNIITNGGPGTIKSAVAEGNAVIIVWNANYLANGNSVTFSMTSDFPGIQLAGGFWTRSALNETPTAITNGSVSQTPLPQALLLFGTGLVGLAGAMRTRPRLTSGPKVPHRASKSPGFHGTAARQIRVA